MVYLPVEAITGNIYVGQSEKKMSMVFRAVSALGGCMLFLDELDSLATSR
jgi:SpoVK/Ycf46/Vps4 family AAA+-type ATPase